ncbi:hypothetical protein HPP92_017245 [Vanilla planifolia]|uniref:Uncharacterized protein n=1 Tax=Vanilla planifolia TaxID=51239 RepID=A0A835UN90_VANPL|nr:hypothetical protein HPP92_017245 [Vanilla planifolia]
MSKPLYLLTYAPMALPHLATREQVKQTKDATQKPAPPVASAMLAISSSVSCRSPTKPHTETFLRPQARCYTCTSALAVLNRTEAGKKP